MRLLLVRHGQTSSNVGHFLDTAVPGADLTPLGREQAAALADDLAGSGAGALTVSTLVRTHQTAAPLADRLGLEAAVDDGLREIAAGDLEMHADEDSVRQYLSVVGSWLHGDLDAACPGGEDGHAFFARFDAAVTAATDRARALDAGTLVVVSHGAAIRTWAGARVGNLSPAFVIATGLLNTGVVALDGDPDTGWTCTSWTGAVVDEAQSDAAEAGPTAEPGSVF